MEHFKHNNKRILIFERHGILWMDIKKKLEGEGYEVNREISITDGNVPHLVICDTDTPQKKELEKLKNNYRKNDISIIYICLEVDDKIMKEREKNVIGIFKKPFDSDTISALVNEHFKNKTI
ncbi:MAG: hypothetical protein Q7W13_09240 [Bacteroidia bacterium]|nr:hypothetical protein [Bacteroidia bacterium]